jgi:hypothetical protein
MKISMYEASIPTFLHTLRNLKTFLEKGVAHAEARKYDPNLLAATRLTADMLPLTRQIQIASDAAKGAAARLTGVDPPKFEDNEATLAELIARVDKTIDYLQGFKPEQFEGAEDRTITIPTRQQTFTFPGLIFLRHWAIPNFFFHVTTAYDLLRQNGVELGKADYLGRVS